ncbi:carbohydrate kinase [Verrucomicrobiaceae bacterium R5-34]|nr:carbohydrate kinase [Verrucomicrobiaceae bacterium R5-34]
MNDTNTFKWSQMKVAGLGELLWDVFPHGKRLGGAPANFACHCRQLGLNAVPVSSVGFDELGMEATSQLNELGLDTSYVQVTKDYPTGRVLVDLDETGKPHYQILEDVAWDHLRYTDALDSLARSTDAVCFGVLAQRCEKTRETIHDFLLQMRHSTLKILDVNLRAPYFSRELVQNSLGLANIVKLSDEELPVLAEYFSFSGDVYTQLEALRRGFALQLVVYTRGADGSVLMAEDEVVETKGVKVQPVDTVGAGDSFTAAICTGLLQKRSLHETNIFANRVAAYVCSRYGATPKLPQELIHEEVHA